MMFITQPQNGNVTEGGDVTFQCSAEEGGSSLTNGWQFTPEGSTDAVTLVTGTNLTGIEMVTVSGGLRTMLTFSGVRREANSGTVVCLALGSVTVFSGRVTVAVWCEYISVKCLQTLKGLNFRLSHIALTCTPQIELCSTYDMTVL